MPDSMIACVIGEECGGAVPDGSPLALCERHLAVAAEWSSTVHGLTDVLPSPCRLCGGRLGLRLASGWLCARCEWRHGDLVDDGLPPPRVDVVYYLRYGDRVKIGTTANPRRRFAAIWHDDVLAMERGDRALEQRRHTEFADERFAATEWFAWSERLGRHVEALRGGVAPWDAYARWMSEALAAQG